MHICLLILTIYKHIPKEQQKRMGVIYIHLPSSHSHAESTLSMHLYMHVNNKCTFNIHYTFI